MTDVQNRVAALTILMISIFGAAGIHQTAEQFIGSVVDVVCPRVVCREREPAQCALIEIDRSGVIDAFSVGGETSDSAQETLSWNGRLAAMALKAASVGALAANVAGTSAVLKISRQRLSTAIESTARVQLSLRDHFCSLCSRYRTSTLVPPCFTLDACSPCVHRRHLLIEHEALSRCSSLCLIRRWYVDGQQSTVLQESCAGLTAAGPGCGVVSRTPCRTSRQAARNSRILFALQLWRQLQ